MGQAPGTVLCQLCVKDKKTKKMLPCPWQSEGRLLPFWLLPWLMKPTCMFDFGVFIARK
jgi:hypothetical protein